VPLARKRDRAGAGFLVIRDEVFREFELNWFCVCFCYCKY
jgi:hypothetical protein